MEGGFAPFSFRTKSGKLSGFEVALAKDVAKQLKLKPVFVQTKFDSLISGLDTKKYDVVYNDMSITSERQKAYTFGREYLFTKSVLITKKGV
ncbi:transporter substrate-binding domain-containing protein [Weissella cibaria]|uniref:transporter substrate-binding domain-containing protein n=1 Tax=Weissella cibaria TaxID=137591 RepID=UPI002A763703|nr:transporter substrate-binding domain-containing protein [Weissella cibaria]MDY2520005.1 transporter substrate-binding domain-containing protein [Weissella cibaria]